MYPSSNVTDGNQNTYWESANSAFPQWVQVDLGSARSASRVVLQLPAAWGARTQTLTLGGSTDATAFTTLKSSAAYTFDPSTGNTASHSPSPPPPSATTASPSPPTTAGRRPRYPRSRSGPSRPLTPSLLTVPPGLPSGGIGICAACCMRSCGPCFCLLQSSV
ncbi:discoidin domain-containing protein [Streptomyces sp. L7]